MLVLTFCSFDETNHYIQASLCCGGQVRKDRLLTLVILGIWSLSLTQFVMVLTATRNPQKAKTFHATSGDTHTDMRKKKKRKKSMCEVRTSLVNNIMFAASQ